MVLTITVPTKRGATDELTANKTVITLVTTIARKLDTTGSEIECSSDPLYTIKIRVYLSWIITTCANHDVPNDHRTNHNHFMQNLTILPVFHETDGYPHLEFGNCNWNTESVASHLVWINSRQLTFCIHWENIKELSSSMLLTRDVGVVVVMHREPQMQ
ncbi:uncharacterized protein [Physcomitrium patens]|uniref:uncharacterized protein n=1 Tax=Physcomitrium patens TaxID=3218 RepID=UPI003CCDBD8C